MTTLFLGSVEAFTFKIFVIILPAIAFTQPYLFEKWGRRKLNVITAVLIRASIKERL